MVPAVLLALAAAAAAAAASFAAVPAPGLLCPPSAASSEAKPTPRRVQPADVTRRIQVLQQRMRARGIHASDLAPPAPEMVATLVAGAAPEGLCARDEAARRLTALVARTRVDQGFVTAKLARLSRWLERATLAAAKKRRAERLLADAGALTTQPLRANALLAQALALINGPNPLVIPEDGPPPSAETPSAPVEPVVALFADAEVAQGCPVQAKAGDAGPDALGNIIERLARIMDERKVRLFDVRSGPELAAAAAHLRELGALWPAARAVCALLARAEAIPIDIGFISGRFGAVRARRPGPEAPAATLARFDDLVRVASDHMAKSELAEAHAALEDLLMLLGEASRPSAMLPRTLRP